MGSELPKQFLEIDGKPILQRTSEVFLDAVPELKVITVLPVEHFETWKNLCARKSFMYPQSLVAGGITRFESVRAALKKVPDGAIVAIHDGVRPFVSTRLILSMLEKMDSCEALVPGIPVSDTLRSTDPAIPDPDRSRTVAVQTPQICLSEGIKKAYREPYRLNFTDDASVASAAGMKVDLVPGERFNIKITTPEDMVFGRAILSLKRP